MMAMARHGAVGLLESESGENDGGPRPAPAGPSVVVGFVAGRRVAWACLLLF